MADIEKGSSPFYPGQPVPLDLFVGRADQIHRIVERGIGQVAAGKPAIVFVQGEYGIGKTSIASFIQFLAAKTYGLHSISANLGGADNIDEFAEAVLEATVRSGGFDSTRGEKVRNWLAKYVGTQQLFGFSVNLEALKKDAPELSTPDRMLAFLREVRTRLQDDGVRGLVLVLDEINGIANHPRFTHFIKGLVDTNATSPTPLPLLLMLCGVEERRRQMIKNHEGVARVFDVVDIALLERNEMEEFFRRAFEKVSMTVEPTAMGVLATYSAGFPKIMHLIGDAAYWLDKDRVVDEDDALGAVLLAAEEFGKKFVDQQVYGALQSPDYRSILGRIAKLGVAVVTFKRQQLLPGLTESEKRKFDNFIQKMKALQVIRQGERQGEYVFIHRMTSLYIWLKSRSASRGQGASDTSDNSPS